MKQMEEAMMTITQQHGTPTLVQPVLPPPVLPPPPTWALQERQQYIAPHVKPIRCNEMTDGSGKVWIVCNICKRMGTHTDDACNKLEKNKGQKEESLENMKPKQLLERKRGKQVNRMNQGYGR